jgi:hypothetical protein
VDLPLNPEQSNLLRPAIAQKVAADKMLDHDVAILFAGMLIPKERWTGDIREESGGFVFTLKEEDVERT